MFTTLRRKMVVSTALMGALAVASMLSPAIPTASGAQATPAAMPAPSAMTADEAIAAITGADGVLRFDVAENMSRFVFADKPVHDDGMPAYGNPFITQGYIYPAGTLTESNGVNPDGSPEFPDKVLGQWTCRGWMVGDGAHTKTGPMVITTQLYNLGSGYGDALLVSEGYELADVGVAVERAITGGTGPYAGARGQGEQAFLGFNASQGVNLTFTLAVAQ